MCGVPAGHLISGQHRCCHRRGRSISSPGSKFLPHNAGDSAPTTGTTPAIACLHYVNLRPFRRSSSPASRQPCEQKPVAEHSAACSLTPLASRLHSTAGRGQPPSLASPVVLLLVLACVNTKSVPCVCLHGRSGPSADSLARWKKLTCCMQHVVREVRSAKSNCFASSTSAIITCCLV